MSWIIGNLATVIVALVLAAVIALIIVYLVRSKRKGKSLCGGGCGGCPMNGACHREQSGENTPKK